MPKSSRPPLPPGFAALWGAVALDLIGFGIVLPILPVYAERFDAGPATAAMIVAAFSAAQFVAAPLWGRLSDRIGRKPVLVAALIGSTIGSLLTGLAGALWLLFLARAIDGASGTSTSLAQAAIGDIADPEERPRLMGMLGAAFGLGFVAGPIIGSIAALGNDRLPFYVAAALSAANAILAIRSVPETHTPSRDSHAPNPVQQIRASVGAGLGSLVVVSLLAMTAFSGFESTFALLMESRFELDASAIYGVFALIGIGLVLVQTRVVGPSVDRFGPVDALTLSLLVTGLGLVVLAPDAGAVAAAVALVLLIVGQGVTSPALASLVISRAGDSRGAALGVQTSAGALGRIIGPIVGGQMFEHVGVASPYVVASVLLAGAAVLVKTSS